MDYFEIFTVVTGILYIILEIKQKPMMWVVGIFTAAAAIVMFTYTGLYASAGLNLYYLVISIIGLNQWKKDAARLSTLTTSNIRQKTTSNPQHTFSDENVKISQTDSVLKADERSKSAIHLNHLTTKVLLWSIAATILATALLYWILDLTGDPMPLLDAIVAVLSAVATWWLSRAYKSQWLIWIAADLLSFTLCLSQGLHWMSILYLTYTLSAIYGYIHWHRHGHYLD